MPSTLVLNASTGSAQSVAEGVGFLLGFAGGFGNALAWTADHIYWIAGIGLVLGLLVGIGENIQRAEAKKRSDKMAADLAEIRAAVAARGADGTAGASANARVDA